QGDAKFRDGHSWAFLVRRWHGARSLARFPLERNRSSHKNSREANQLERIRAAKVYQLFRNSLWRAPFARGAAGGATTKVTSLRAARFLRRRSSSRVAPRRRRRRHCRAQARVAF